MRSLSRKVSPRHLVATCAVAGLLAFAHLRLATRSEAANRRLLRTLLADRFTTGRLAGQHAWRACALADSSTPVPRVSCDPPPRPGTRQHERIDDAARHTAAGDSSTYALRSRALRELRFGKGSHRALDRAVLLLERTRRDAPHDPAVLNDLAVTYLEIAERDQQLTPLLRALDTIEQAALRDTLRPEILFNRALILQRLYLRDGAARAWARYLAAERDARWKAEAESHARRLPRIVDGRSWGGLLHTPPDRFDAAGRARIAAAVRESPQAVRDSCFVLLGAWGEAVLRGERARADRLLGAAREVGGAFARRKGDAGVALAVRAIDASAADPRRLRLLATGHTELAAGFRLFYGRNASSAAEALARAERTLRAAASPANAWAAFYRAAAEMELGRYAAADVRLRGVRAAAGAGGPTLAGKALWVRGVVQVRQGNYEGAIRLYREAEPYLAGERDNRAALSYLLSEGLALAGQAPASRAEALRGLRLLSPFRATSNLNNHLSNVAAIARREGLSYAALAVMDEVLAGSRSPGRADVVARAHRSRAGDLLALGRRDAARAELEAGLRWADSLPRGEVRDRVRADVLLVLGRMVRDEDPRAGLRLLEGVADTYRRVKIELHVPVALYEASLAARAAGDEPTARRQVAEAIRYVERQQDSFTSAEARATFHETVENVFDAMIRLQLDAGRPDSAFAYLERARAAIQPAPGRRSSRGGRLRPSSLEQIVAALPHDVAFTSYALLPDRLVVWTATHRGWRYHAVSVRRDSVAAWVERLVEGMDETGGEALRNRARLYDLLVRPAAGELGQARRLTVAPDRELYRVPFAALWDRSTRRYLVEDREVTTVPSGAFLLAADSLFERLPSNAAALVVGDPTLGPGSPAELEPLPSALREAREIAALYDSSEVLVEGAASRGAVLARLSKYQVFHFAGHAVFNPEQPGSSYLALAAGGVEGDGTLRAWEIGELRPSKLQVVVLSACSTLSPRPSRAGPAAGLAFSFLRAGAPATVSTLWDVSDETTRPLLVEFHRRFAAGATVAEALRGAQLQAMRSPEDALRAPAAWAAFIYTGP